MKKRILMFVLLFMFIIPLKVDAASVNISSSNNGVIDANSEFTITINVVGGNNVLGLLGNLSYDSSKLELVSSSGSNGFVMTVGTNVLLDSISAKSGNFAIGTLKFKAKSSLSAGSSTTISINNIVVSDGSNEFSVGNASRNISVSVPKSTNNSLKYIAIDGNTLNGFNTNTKKYQLVVENNISSINITAEANDSKTRVNGTGSKSLSLYSNTFTVEAISESGSKNTYTIVVIRKDQNGNTAPLSGDNKLKNLSIKDYEIVFNADNFSYELTVDNYVKQLDIIADASSDKAIVNIEKKELEVGSNTIKVIVKAENNSEATYTINVTRSSETPTLNISNISQLANVTTNNVKLKLDNDILSKETISQLKQYNKESIIEFDNYTLLLSEYDDSTDLSLKLYFDNEDIKKVKSIMDYREGIYFKAETNNKTKINCLMKVNYEGNLNLYSYDGEVRFEKLLENENNIVKIEDIKNSVYVLTLANMNQDPDITVVDKSDKGNNIIMYIIIIVLFIICSVVSLKHIFLRKSLKENNKVTDINNSNNNIVSNSSTVIGQVSNQNQQIMPTNNIPSDNINQVNVVSTEIKKEEEIEEL